MILNGDAKALEVVCGAYLSQDKIMMEEIRQGLDMHTANMKAFNLPSRLIAKVLMFRIMYGGSGYSFSKDPDFESVSTSEKFWTSKIEAFYNKYTGFKNWHSSIVNEAMSTGQLIMPTGRIYKFEWKTNFKGEKEAPQTIIKNYPVQGLGADIMSIARVSFMRRFKNENICGLLVNTVHDSIVCDIHPSERERVMGIFHNVFSDIPLNFSKLFGVEFNLPLLVEVGYGNNMKELTEIKLDNI